MRKNIRCHSLFFQLHILPSSVINDAIVTVMLTLLGAVIAGFKQKVTFLIGHHTWTVPVAACISSTDTGHTSDLSTSAWLEAWQGDHMISQIQLPHQLNRLSVAAWDMIHINPLVKYKHFPQNGKTTALKSCNLGTWWEFSLVPVHKWPIRSY